MSKIQDALQKVQRQSSRSATSEQTPATTDYEQFGSYRSSDDETGIRESVEHQYAGGVVDVNREALREAGLLATVVQQKRIADQYRQIKRPLLANASSRRTDIVPRGNLIMVGSAIPGEGKTFTCINLALSIALEQDWSVVLVDADCAKPHISRVFGLKDRPGLLDILRDSSNRFDEYVVNTNIRNLAILPAGKQDELATELLSSERMDRLCEKVSAENSRRIVLFDTSPLLFTTEAPIVSSHLGQVALVVAAERTSQQIVLNAIELLDDSKAINVILNKAGAGDAMMGDFYGYGYGYGATAEEEMP